MSDLGNGVSRRTEFDAVAELRGEMDERNRAHERWLAAIEDRLCARIDGQTAAMRQVNETLRLVLDEQKALSQHIVRVLDRVLDVEKQLEAKPPKRARKK